jgi:hypothetical protein
VTESQAAGLVLAALLGGARDAWPHLERRLREATRGAFVVEDAEAAVLDVGLALLAYGLLAVRRVCPADQAERLSGWVRHHLAASPHGAHVVGELDAYERARRDAIAVGDGLELEVAIPRRLLTRLCRGSDPGEAGPTAERVLAGCLTGLVGRWKDLGEAFTILPDELPPAGGPEGSLGRDTFAASSMKE